MVDDKSKFHAHELGMEKVESLSHFKLGHALAVVRIDDDGSLQEAQSRGWGKSPWAHGPYVYHIGQVIHLSQPVPVKGNLGAFRLPPDARDAILAQLPDGLGIDTSTDIRGLSVKQPWLQRIMFEGKDVENRTRRIFSTKRATIEATAFPAFQPHMRP